MSIYTINDPIKFRNSIRNEIKNILIDDTIGHNVDKISTNIEIAIYNYSIRYSINQKGIPLKWASNEFVQIYIDHLKTIIYNLKKYNELKLNIIEGKILPDKFVFGNHMEWDPLKWKPYIEEQNNKNNMKNNRNIQANTDMFTCKKCHNNECTYYEMQTRSADESATIFVTCLKCGKNWKE